MRDTDFKDIDIEIKADEIEYKIERLQVAKKKLQRIGQYSVYQPNNSVLSTVVHHAQSPETLKHYLPSYRYGMTANETLQAHSTLVYFYATMKSSILGEDKVRQLDDISEELYILFKHICELYKNISPDNTIETFVLNDLVQRDVERLSRKGKIYLLSGHNRHLICEKITLEGNQYFSTIYNGGIECFTNETCPPLYCYLIIKSKLHVQQEADLKRYIKLAYCKQISDPQHPTYQSIIYAINRYRGVIIDKQCGEMQTVGNCSAFSPGLLLIDETDEGYNIQEFFKELANWKCSRLMTKTTKLLPKLLQTYIDIAIACFQDGGTCNITNIPDLEYFITENLTSLLDQHSRNQVDNEDKIKKFLTLDGVLDPKHPAAPIVIQWAAEKNAWKTVIDIATHWPVKHKIPTNYIAAFLTAVFAGETEAVKALIHAGVPINIPFERYHYRGTALHWVIYTYYRQSLHMLHLLIENDADLSAALDSTGKTVLQVANETGHIDDLFIAANIAGDSSAVDKLIQAGAQINQPFWVGSYFCTALHWAIIRNHYGITLLLLQNQKIKADTKDNYGCTAIEVAAYSNKWHVVNLIANRLTDPDDSAGYTIAFFYAVVARQTKTVDLLIRSGARINFIFWAEGQPTTPLNWAISWAITLEDAGMMGLLLQSGADLFAMLPNGYSPAQLAILRASQSEPFCKLIMSQVGDEWFHLKQCVSGGGYIHDQYYLQPYVYHYSHHDLKASDPHVNQQQPPSTVNTSDASFIPISRYGSMFSTTAANRSEYSDFKDGTSESRQESVNLSGRF